MDLENDFNTQISINTKHLVSTHVSTHGLLGSSSSIGWMDAVRACNVAFNNSGVTTDAGQFFQGGCCLYLKNGPLLMVMRLQHTC